MKAPLFPALQLTDACNKNCRACLRIPGHQSHRLSFDDFQRYLRDITVLSQRYAIDFQFVTGGEPTIWKDGDKDVADILSELSQKTDIAHITMPTNGKRFETMNYVEDLLARISRNVTRPVIIGVSIAGYQDNFAKKRCVPLDHLLKAAAKTSGTVLPIALVTLSRNDPMHEDLKAAYPDVIQRITPLAPLGAGEDMMEDCPVIGLNGTKKTMLGDYLPHFTRDVIGKLAITPRQFEDMPNITLMNRLSRFAHCGQSPFIDDRWHYFLPFREDPSFDIAKLGEIRATAFSDFISTKPFLRDIRSMGVIQAALHHRNRLKPDTKEKLDRLLSPGNHVPVAYRGCMICKMLAEIGVWRDIQEQNAA